MGRRRNRKQRRREEWRTSYAERRRSRLPHRDLPDGRGYSPDPPEHIDPWAHSIAFGNRHEHPRGAAPTCDICFEFVPGEGGRGTCLHPASGIHAPWTDTLACPFFTTRRHPGSSRGWD